MAPSKKWNEGHATCKGKNDMGMAMFDSVDTFKDIKFLASECSNALSITIKRIAWSYIFSEGKLRSVDGSSRTERVQLRRQLVQWRDCT